MAAKTATLAQPLTQYEILNEKIDFKIEALRVDLTAKSDTEYANLRAEIAAVRSDVKNIHSQLKTMWLVISLSFSLGFGITFAMLGVMLSKLLTL